MRFHGSIFVSQMTSGELKFALRVEQALNTIPEPEFRQLMVEALMVLSLIVEYRVSKSHNLLSDLMLNLKCIKANVREYS